MSTFSAEIFHPGLLDSQPNRPSKVSPRASTTSAPNSSAGAAASSSSSSLASAASSAASSPATSPGADSGPPSIARTPSASSIKSGGSDGYNERGSGAHNSHNSTPSSPNLTLPPRRNILYRIFHPHEEKHHASPVSAEAPGHPVSAAAPPDARWGRSRRTYGSGSEAESEDDYHSDDSVDSDGVFSKSVGSRPRQNSLAEAMARAEREKAEKTRAKEKKTAVPPARSTSVKSRAKPTGMFASSDDSSDPESSDPEASEGPKRSASRTSLFKDLLHGGRSKSKSTSGPSSPVSAHSLATPQPPASSSDAKSSDSDTDHGDHGHHNLFKDLIMNHRGKRSPSVSKGSPPPSHDSHSSSSSHSAIDAGKPPMIGRAQPEPARPAMSRSQSETSLSKYGKKEEVLGRGANAVVRLCTPLNSGKKYAIKEFRKRRKDETQVRIRVRLVIGWKGRRRNAFGDEAIWLHREYVKKLIAEFCISSTLHNENVVSTVDLIQDEKRQWCVVMEYCAGGDLYSRIHSGSLTDSSEVNW
ncbi:hypothetical protein BDK51DRAFT_51741 [Blyttiomyces helicus]|uniref:Protein kinase domain-containing protein n=1 Tax=Blyttiomyces helicus TaxID=388810 RepID=A0A4P9VVS1_9FUNG|nr:hypothetical protein BDK51DRAFT_51741 [Blyttiomyces helicus]|eukprot:RKO82935.1 hypothetical protein BDK51DRAFT_51741 [Blyttiomyces helicus]